MGAFARLTVSIGLYGDWASYSGTHRQTYMFVDCLRLTAAPPLSLVLLTSVIGALVKNAQQLYG